DKIVIAGMAIRIEAAVSKGAEYFPAKSTTVIYSNDEGESKLKALLAFLNSKYASYLFRQENSQLSMAGGYMNVNKNNLSALELPVGLVDDKNLSNYANEHLDLSGSLQNKSNGFRQLVASEFDVEK